MRKLLFLFVFVSQGVFLFSQNEPQIVGRVLNKVDKKGIEGVEVRLISTNEDDETDAYGKFKFNGSFERGTSYSFTLHKPGYLVVGDMNRVVGELGTLLPFYMVKDINAFLRITVKDERNGELLPGVQVSILGQKKTTDDFGTVEFNFAEYGNQSVSARLIKDCYKSKIVDVTTKGDYDNITLIKTCADKLEPESMSLAEATETLDRAIEAKNGSRQGQVKAVERLYNLVMNSTIRILMV